MLTNPLRYDSVGDVRRRLHNTFVLYQGYPVYVTTEFNDLFIEGVSFKDWDGQEATMKSFYCHSSDVDIDLESPKMGWANMWVRSATRPVYFLRTVHRQYSQGIDPKKVMWLDPSKKTKEDEEELRLGFSFRYYKELIPFANMMIEQGYPSIQAASTEKVGAAFGRDWAFIPTKSDNYRTVYNDHQPVATFNRSTNVFLFVPGSLTKTRRMQLELLFHTPQNIGASYGLDERA